MQKIILLVVASLANYWIYRSKCKKAERDAFSIPVGDNEFHRVKTPSKILPILTEIGLLVVVLML